MLRYVVFDYGKTLIEYNEIAIARHYVKNDGEAEELARVFFDRLYCDKIDAGTMAEEERVRLARARLPEKYHALLPDMTRTWYRYLPHISGMPELVENLYRSGIGLYLLSNISAEFANHTGEEPILRHFNGIVLSGPIRLIKPDIAIYRYLLDRYELEPSEGLFVDDREENVRAAIAVGMDGYLFDGDAARLATYIEEKGRRYGKGTDRQN